MFLFFYPYFLRQWVGSKTEKTEDIFEMGEVEPSSPSASVGQQAFRLYSPDGTALKSKPY
jgi:hypothetical protein